MKIVAKKINNKTVRACPKLKPVDERPVKGAEYFPEIYGNIFCVAKKKSGKTTVIYNIVKNCISKETEVIVFASTVNKDDSYYTIRKYCESKGISFTAYTSLKDDDGNNQIAELVKFLELKAKAELEKEDEDEEEEPKRKSILLVDTDSDEEPKRRKSKYRVPDYLLIFDDLSNELKDRWMRKLLKENRHYKAKVIVSSQWLHDMYPDERKQIDYFLVFKGLPEAKLTEIYKDADLSIPFDDFVTIYKCATKEKYSFLYIDTKNEQFRINFNTEILIK